MIIRIVNGFQYVLSVGLLLAGIIVVVMDSNLGWIWVGVGMVCLPACIYMTKIVKDGIKKGYW